VARHPFLTRLWFDVGVGARDDVDPGLPLKLWPCSNGEFLPPPLDDLRTEAMRRARAAAEEHTRRYRWSRRRFLLSSAGMVAGLAALESCTRDRSRSTGTDPGGTFSVPRSAITDPEEATTTVHGAPSTSTTAEPTTTTDEATTTTTAPPDEDVVVDVQTHFLESGEFGLGFPQSGCGEANPGDCFSAEYWRDLVLAQSDTRVAVISAVPVVADPDPLSVEAMERGRALAAELCGDGHVLIQGHAVPDVGPIEAAVAAMEEVAATHELSAWKVYTHSPSGWFLDDHDPDAPAIGQRFLDACRSTGVPTIAVHKGLSGQNPYASPVDIGPAAAANPDLRFLVYHSGYEVSYTEGAYDPDGPGVDRLVRSVTDAGIGPGGNVYAELGSTWRRVMGNPDEAAHVLGKLLVAFGPERMLWGTDSIWYGSPQDQIAAFRAFEITPAYQEQFGYPALTPDVKRRILGRNAVELLGIEVPPPSCGPAEVEGLRQAAGTANRTHGPVSRRDVVTTFLREHPWVAQRIP
jgi:predicted TIM-barrel fold metal-dependent hydrolase